MYMQDERPLGGPVITSRTQQTDQSYIVKNHKPPQNNNSEDDPRTKPSQTEQYFEYDQYVRNRNPDAQSPTGPTQNCHATANIRYPTQFMPLKNQSVNDNTCVYETSHSFKCKSQPSGAYTNFADVDQYSAVSCLSKSTPDVPSCYKSMHSEPCFVSMVANEKSDVTGWCSQESAKTPKFCPTQVTSNHKAHIDSAQIVSKSSKIGTLHFAETTPNTSRKDCICQSITQTDGTASDRARTKRSEVEFCPLKKCHTQSFPFDPCAEETFEARSDDSNWHSASSQPITANTCSSSCVRTSFPLEGPSQIIQKSDTTTTWNTCPSDQSVYNKSSMGCTENTSSWSQSVMAKVTCLCSSEQKANLCNCGRKPNDGPPFARIEKSALATCKTVNTGSHSTKVVFTKSDGYCDCPSSSSTSLHNNEIIKNYETDCGNKTQFADAPECLCAPEIDLEACSCEPTYQKSDIPPMKSYCRTEIQTDQKNMCATDNNVEHGTKYNSCTTCTEGTSVEHIFDLLGMITNTKDCNGDRYEMVHQLFRDLTTLLRNEEDKSRPTPLSYEDCMDAVAAGNKPAGKQPKTKEQVQRLKCLNQMEQYLNKCFPHQMKASIPEIEIAATEPDPHFNPNDWNEEEQYFGDCQSSQLVSIGDFYLPECNCSQTQETQSKTYTSCNVTICLADEKSRPISENGTFSGSCGPENELQSKSPTLDNVTICDSLPQKKEVEDDNIIDKDQPNACSFEPHLTERERLLCDYLLCRMGELGDDGGYPTEQTDDDPRPPLDNQPCVCCHCRALICDNQCNTITKALDTVLYDPVAEMKFFIDSIIFDMQAMEQVMKKNNLSPKNCQPSQTMGNAPGESFPVTITDVSSLGCRALYVQWELEDCSGIGGYEIYVDGHLTNRFYSFRHEAGVVSNVDVTKRHQIVLRAQPIGEEFGIDEYERHQNAMVHAHPEMQVGAQQPWSPSVYFYEP